MMRSIIFFLALNLASMTIQASITLKSEFRFFPKKGTVNSLSVSYSPHPINFTPHTAAPERKVFSFEDESEQYSLANFDTATFDQALFHSSPTLRTIKGFISNKIKILQDCSSSNSLYFTCLFKLPSPAQPIYADIRLSKAPGAMASIVSLRGYPLQKTAEVTQISNLLTAIFTDKTIIQKYGSTMLTTSAIGLSLMALVSPKLSERQAGSISDILKRMPKPSANSVYQIVTDAKTKFDDVIGLEEAKEELRDIIAAIKNPSSLIIPPPRGILFEGLPGNGKTFLAKATAGEANCAFLSISASQFIEKYVGVGAQRVRDLFQSARALAPCIIFIDELDAVGAKRSENANSSGEREQTINQLLTEMDGFSTDPERPVFVIAATNRADMLDDALKRPGRFDKIINIPPPCEKDRLTILKQTLKRHTNAECPADLEADLKDFARETAGRNAADVTELMTDCLRKRSRREGSKTTKPTKEDLEAASLNLAMGALKPHELTDLEKERIATRVAGQAFMCTHCFSDQATSPLKMVSIENRSKACGFVMLKPLRTETMETEKQLMHELSITLAGILVYDVFFGANNRDTTIKDLKKHAQNIADKVLQLDHLRLKNLTDFLTRTSTEITTQLTSNKTKIEKIKNELLSKTTLTSKEVYELAH